MRSLIAPGVSGASTSGVIKPPVRGGRSDTVWRSVAQIAGGLADVQAGTEAASAAFQARKYTQDAQTLLHPFKIYQLPGVLRGTPNYAADWLKFRVRAGRVYINGAPANVAGTDAADTDPDAENYPNVSDISVPSNTASYKIWIEISGANASINSGANGWSGYPNTSATIIPVGIIDTQSSSGSATAVVRQILRADVLTPAGGNGTAVGMFIVKGIFQDYCNCHTWDGVTEGNVNVYVAKPFLLRGSINSENIDGSNISYSNYAANTYVTRVATSGGNSETQVIVPRLQVGSKVLAASITTDVNVSNVAVTWIDVNVDGRAWARKFDQP
jgi:hypothetical protein